MNDEEYTKIEELIDAYYKVIDKDTTILDFEEGCTFEEYKDMVIGGREYIIDETMGRRFILSRRWEDDTQARLQKIKESEEE